MSKLAARDRAAGEPTGRKPAPPRIDREALLAALVIAPDTYSRNRFFDLFADPEVYRVRRRALQIRSIVRHVTRQNPAELGEIVSVTPTTGDRVKLTYAVPAIGLTRTAMLDPMEIALVRFAMARTTSNGGAPAHDPDRVRIEAALARLAPATERR